MKRVGNNRKIWPPTGVVNFDLFFDRNKKYGYGVPSEMSEKALLSYYLQVCVRYIFSIGDFAYRNFLRIDDKVYNLDIEGVGISRTIRMKKSERDIMVKFIEKMRKK